MFDKICIRLLFLLFETKWHEVFTKLGLCLIRRFIFILIKRAKFYINRSNIQWFERFHDCHFGVALWMKVLGKYKRVTALHKKRKFSIKDFISKYNQIRNLVTFIEEILNEKLHFFVQCSVSELHYKDNCKSLEKIIRRINRIIKLLKESLLYQFLYIQNSHYLKSW